MERLYRHGNNAVHNESIQAIWKSAVHLKCNECKLRQVTTRSNLTTMHLKVLISLASLYAFGKAANNLVPSFLSE